MKKISIIILILINYCLVLNAQQVIIMDNGGGGGGGPRPPRDSVKYDYLATYNHTYITEKDTTINGMLLLMNENQSVFLDAKTRSFAKMMSARMRDGGGPGVNRQAPSMDIMKEMRENSPKVKYTILKDFVKQENYYLTRAGMQMVKLKKKNSDFEWEIIDGDTTILGYVCKKAICNYNNEKFVAWYTETLPMSDGPYRFSGLPGLIVQIANVNKSNIFVLTGFEKKEVYNNKVNIDRAQDATVEKIIEMNANILETLRAQGANIKIHGADAEELKRFRNNNNPIELALEK